MNPSSKNRISRHNARQCALQAIYQWQLSANPIKEIQAQFTQYHGTKNVDLDYFSEVILGVEKHQQELDSAIEPFIERPIEDIDPIELAILRIATFELSHRLDVPYRVVINEALELVKRFGSAEGFKFINSILDRAAKVIRKDEMKNG